MPFQHETYRPELTGSILELMMAGPRARATAARQSGDAQARAMEMRGQNTAHLVGSLGQIAQGVTGQILQSQQDAPRREMQQLELDAAKTEQRVSEGLRQLFSGEQPPSPEHIVAIAGPERGARIVQGLAALRSDPAKDFDNASKVVRDVLAGMDALPEDARAEFYPSVRQNLVARRVIKPEDAPEQYDPRWFQSARNYGREPQKPAEGFTLPEGSTRFGPDGQPIASVPKPAPEPKSYPVTTFDGRGRPVRKLVTEAELQAGVPEYEAPKTGSTQRFWVMRDGKPLRVTEGEYRPGDQPASTREQGRPVTSGDAGRVADFDTSMDDLKVLETTLAGKGATGVEAAVRAKLPAWANELTSGWGNDAKSRNAVIKRVRQVIGKALEGGVLRKEDEAKYADILPTIVDTAEVATSKINGLKTAIDKRRVTLIDSLEDAGYDVTKYRARAPHGQGGQADPMGIR